VADVWKVGEAIDICEDARHDVRSRNRAVGFDVGVDGSDV
jgi:hypothetical protein